MTIKEFKAAMLRGLGRCILALQHEPEKFRQTVLWACQRNIAYDAQSEGTRSWYVYAMASAYPDPETFIQAASKALQKYRSHSGWDLLHLSELLMFFATDGHQDAKLAVEEKYRDLLEAMYQRKRRPKGLFHTLSDLEQLGLVLCTDDQAFLRIAGDFGKLYQEKAYMEDGDFEWFFASKGSLYQSTMEQAAEKDANIAYFLHREQTAIDTWEKRRIQHSTSTPQELTGVRLSRWLAKHADFATLTQYAEIYLNQSQPDLRAKALEAFSLCAYPNDPTPIIEDTCSACEDLRRAAWDALENLRHPKVRSFALNNIQNGLRTLENFALLMVNYSHQDAELSKELLQELIDTEDADKIHSAGFSIFRAFSEGSQISPPVHLLPLLYEYNPCSYCRETTLQYLSEHQMLSQDILKECLYDSNSDIRRMAEKEYGQ